MDTPTRRNLLATLARDAGHLLLRHFRGNLKIEAKSHAVDLVTQADQEAESALVERILATYPEDGILAEEGSHVKGTSGVRWIIDPLDGTTNFAHGFPHFCVSIAVHENNDVHLAAVYDPHRDELFFAERGKGAYLNGSPIQVRFRSELAECLSVSGFPYDRRQRLDSLLERVRRALLATRGFRRLGSAALDLAYVADGRLDLYWEDGLKPWDCAAGQLLVREAGGSVCDFRGGPLDIFTGEIVACHPNILAEALRTLFQDGDAARESSHSRQRP